MHLTNYSINKHNPEYLACEDECVDNVGNKWSFAAVLKMLSKNGTAHALFQF